MASSCIRPRRDPLSTPSPGRAALPHRPVTLRIVAGELGGRYIDAPPGRSTRPTSERAREAWFSALGERVSEAAVVDLFAGSGALGIEALSRGASTVTFVEGSRRAARVLRANLERLAVLDRSVVRRTDVFRFLEERRTKPPFDVALADPPYGGGQARRLVETFRSFPFACLLCVEHEPGALEGARETVWQRRYGDTAITFLSVPDGGSVGEPATVR